MEPKDGKEPALPEGFEHVQERLEETVDRLHQIDEQLRNMPKEKGPTPQYNYPHFVGRLVPGSRDKTRIALQEKQHELKMEALSKTEADTRGTDGKAGRVVRDVVREKLFPNHYRQISKEDRLADKSTEKEIEQSQDYVDAQLVERTAAREKEKQKQQPQAPTNSGLSMSARFSASLSYTRSVEQVNSDPQRGRDRQTEMDRD